MLGTDVAKLFLDLIVARDQVYMWGDLAGSTS